MLPAFRHLDKEGQGVLSIPVLREYASLCRSNNLEDAVLEAVLSEADLDETGVRLAQFASFTRALVDKAAWYLSWAFMRFHSPSLSSPTPTPTLTPALTPKATHNAAPHSTKADVPQNDAAEGNTPSEIGAVADFFLEPDAAMDTLQVVPQLQEVEQGSYQTGNHL